MPGHLRPFVVTVPDEAIADLHARLDRTRWPHAELVDDASQGVRLAALRALTDHWRHRYDWRRCEAALNRYPQFLTEIDGVNIHFLHVRSRHDDALPMILTHGWPGSIIEFLKVIGPLTDPEAHGGDNADAFHLVIPSLPGFGFSGKPRETGWNIERIAAAWDMLMARLDYTRYVAQGGDVGSAVSSKMGERAAPGLAAVHTNQPFVLPPPPYDDLSADEQRMMHDLGRMQSHGVGYAIQQGTRPQTLGEVSRGI